MSFVLLMAMVGTETQDMPKLECPPGDYVVAGASCQPTPKEANDPPNLSAPAEPANNRVTWVRTEDYPASALRENAMGVTGINLTVGEDGKPTKCKVTQSSGNQDLDIAACRAASERALFNPARDAAGRPTIGSYTTRIRWQIPSGLPNLIPEPSTIVQSFIVEKDGSVSNCKFEKTPQSNDSGTSPCDVTKNFMPPVDEDGNPVRKKVAIAMVIKVEDVDEDE